MKGDGSRVIVVVAGMDGALSRVVAGLVAAPVVALGGVAALLAPLIGRAPGLAVASIDSGYGVGNPAAPIAAPAENLP